MLALGGDNIRFDGCIEWTCKHGIGHTVGHVDQKQMGYPVDVVTMPHDQFTDQELAERNVHGVPVDAIARMRARWEA